MTNPKQEDNKGENFIPTKDQLMWVRWMLNGSGLDQSKKAFPGAKDRKLMQQLIDLKLAFEGKNHSGKDGGMWHIPPEERKRIQDWLNKLKL